MSGEHAIPLAHVRLRCVLTVARREWRRAARSRLVAWTLLLAALGWYAAGALRVELRSAVVVAMLYGLAAVLLVGAGALADDLDRGATMLDLLHGAAPLEIVLGTTLGVVAAAAPAALVLALGMAVGAARAAPLVAGILLAWIAVLALGWAALIVLLGSLVRGKGNAVLLLPLLVFGGFPPAELPVGVLPDAVERAVRWLWTILPLPAHVAALRDTLLLGAGPRAAPALALLAAPPTFVLLAAARLARLAPAARCIQ